MSRLSREVTTSVTHLEMRFTLPLFIRIIPRNAIQPTKGGKIDIVPEPIPQRLEKKETLIGVLTRQREAAGTAWPANLRIEPVVTKKTFERVHTDYRTELKALLKES